MYYAEIVCYEKDREQSIIHTKPINNLNNLSERNITTKDIKDDDLTIQKEFVSARVIFGLVGNDMAICFSKTKIQTFTNYINYLLNTYYWQDPEKAQAIILTDVITKNLTEKLKTTNVKCVKIGQVIHSEMHQDNKHYFTKDSLMQKFSHWLKIQDGYTQDLDDANLRLNIQLDYPYSTTSHGQKLLDDITTALATIDDNMISIDFTDGTDYKGGNIRVKGRISQHKLGDNGFDRLQLQKDIRSFLEQSLE